MAVNTDWQKIKVKRISPSKLKKVLENENVYILDVRPLNFKKNTSFIEGSFLLPLLFLTDRYQEIPRDRPIVITDWAMKQSPVAAKFLTSKGYRVLGVLRGGLERWESEHLPVEKRQPTKQIGPLSNSDPAAAPAIFLKRFEG